MDKFIERELKLLVSEEDFQKIIKSYDFTKPVIQTNTYYDTDDKKIKKQNGAMRIRTINDVNIFTLKIRKDEVTHFEYEKKVDTDDIHNIKDPEIQAWLKKYKIPSDTKKTVSFTTERRTIDFENGQLCADKTSYENHIDYEIEYEYSNDHDGVTFFNTLLKKFNLKYEKNCPSKIARAFND